MVLTKVCQVSSTTQSCVTSSMTTTTRSKITCLTTQLRDIFDDNDDEIQDYLSDWVHDNIGDGESSFSYFAKDVEDITQLKGKLVWAYLELKAYECLVDAKHPDFY